MTILITAHEVPASVNTRPSRHDILPLTGLRGIAALLIVLYHYQIVQVPKGYLAVDLFFLLSGFVMALTYGEAMRPKYARTTVLSFLKKRFARIYPIYAFLTLITFFLPELGTQPTLVQLVINGLLLQQFGLDLIDPSLGVSIIGQGWSISAELCAYLAFPFTAQWLLWRRERIAVAIGCTAFIVLLLMNFGPPSNIKQAGPLDHHWKLLGLIRCLTEFTIGMVIYRLWQRGVTVRAWLALSAAAGIVLLARHIHGDVFIVGAFAIVLMDAAQKRSTFGRVLRTRPCVLLGEWSYSLYLLHILPYFYLRSYSDRLCAALNLPHARAASLVLLLLIDILLAALCFRLIEKPCRALLRARTGKRSDSILYDPPAP